MLCLPCACSPKYRAKMRLTSWCFKQPSTALAICPSAAAPTASHGYMMMMRLLLCRLNLRDFCTSLGNRPGISDVCKLHLHSSTPKQIAACKVHSGQSPCSSQQKCCMLMLTAAVKWVLRCNVSTASLLLDNDAAAQPLASISICL